MAFTHLLAAASDLKDGPVTQGIEGEVNDTLATLLNRNVVGVELVVKDKARRQGRELAVQVSHDTVGAVVLTSPFEVITFMGRTLASVSAEAATFRALNPAWFYAVPFIKFINEFAAADQPFVLVQFYCQDPNGSKNWHVNNAGAPPAGGADTQVQFNDGGVFNGDARFTFQKVTGVLTFTGLPTFNRPTNRMDFQGNRLDATPVGVGPFVNGVAINESIAVGHRLSVDITGGGAPTTTINVVFGENIRVVGDLNQALPNVVLGSDIFADRCSGDVIIGRTIRTGINCKNTVIVSPTLPITLDSGRGVFLGRVEAASTGDEEESIAIGWATRVVQRAIALGRRSNSGHQSSVALGDTAVTTAVNQVMLGTASYRVDVLGKAYINNIQLDGVQQLSIHRVGVNSTLTRTLCYVNQTAAGITTLLWASPQSGDRVVFVNSSAGANVLGGNGNTIMGAATINLLAGESVELVWDAVAMDWLIY